MLDGGKGVDINVIFESQLTGLEEMKTSLKCLCTQMLPSELKITKRYQKLYEMRKFNNHKVSKRRRHSFLIQQTSIKDSIGRMSGNGNPLSFIQSHRRFLCVHVVNSKILFLAVFETGLVCNESGGFVFGLPVGVQRFRASLNSEAYSCRHCVYRFCVV